MGAKKDFLPDAGAVPPRNGVVTAHAVIYAELKSALMNGDFQPGDRLIVRELSERFATSAMPVREALRKLVNDEALYDHPNRGVTVPAADATAVADLFRVRCAIEGQAAEWAAATISAAELEAIHRINDAMKACVQTQEVSHYLALNRQFHFTIYRAARSKVLVPMIERLWLRAGPLLNIMRQEATIQQGLDHHTGILDAIDRGDGPQSRRAMVADIADASDILQRAVPYWTPAAGNPRQAANASGSRDDRHIIQNPE
jgi:DNA-binding GntR family transcriptional regulator